MSLESAFGIRRSGVRDLPLPYRQCLGSRLARLTPLVIVLALSLRLPAAEPPAPPPARAEGSPVNHAQHDLARWTERGDALGAAAARATAEFEALNGILREAKAAQSTAEMALADAAAAVTMAEEAKTASARSVALALDALQRVEAAKGELPAALDAARAAVDLAAKEFESSTANVPRSHEQMKQAEIAKGQADRNVALAEATVKPVAAARSAADKALAEIQPQFQRAKERLSAFEKAAPLADPAATRLVQTIKHDRPLISCRFDSQGDYLFAGAQDNCLHRWDLFTGASAHPKEHKSWLGALAVVPQAGDHVIAGGHEGRLTWWNGRESDPPALRTIEAHKGYIRAVAVSPDGRFVASGGNDSLVRIWSAVDGTLVRELAGHTRHVYNVAFHPSSKFVVSGDLLGTIKQWDVDSWRETREFDAKVLWKYDTGFRADAGGVRSFAFSSDGRHMAAAGVTEVTNAFAGVGVPCVVLFDWESGKQLKVMKPKDAFQGFVHGIRFSPAGDFIVGAGGGQGGGIWFWKLDDEKSFHFVKLPNVAYDMDLHPDGLRLAVALFDKTLRIYDMAPAFETAQATPATAK